MNVEDTFFKVEVIHLVRDDDILDAVGVFIDWEEGIVLIRELPYMN